MQYGQSYSGFVIHSGSMASAYDAGTAKISPLEVANQTPKMTKAFTSSSRQLSKRIINLTSGRFGIAFQPVQIPFCNVSMRENLSHQNKGACMNGKDTTPKLVVH
jgi:hypothetical protein